MERIYELMDAGYLFMEETDNLFFNIVFGILTFHLIILALFIGWYIEDRETGEKDDK